MAVTLKVNKQGLVPVKFLISEAGLGIRKDEVRGVSLEIAERLIAAKQAEAADVKAEAAGETK